MDSAAVGIGICTMSCSYCEARKDYATMAERHAAGETYAHIAASLGVTAQYCWQSVQKAWKYGWRPKK